MTCTHDLQTRSYVKTYCELMDIFTSIYNIHQQETDRPHIRIQLETTLIYVSDLYASFDDKPFLYTRNQTIALRRALFNISSSCREKLGGKHD